MDTGSIKKPTAGHGGGRHGFHDGDASEFGLTGRSTTVEGCPVDSGSAKDLRKPGDYNEVGTRARKFT
jgi:hypothetical protein